MHCGKQLQGIGGRVTRHGRSKTAQLRPASIAAVAHRAGVSIATVSRVMNGIENKASSETASRVMAAVESLGYRPQSVGRALRQRESRIVGVLAANLGNPAMAAAAASIELALRDAGFVMALCDTHEDAGIQDEYLAEMEAQLARGIVLLVAVPSPKLDALRAAGRPLIFVNRRDPGAEDSAFVGIDDHAAGRAVAEHWLAKGETGPFGLLHASLAFSAGRHRAAGYLDRLAEAGIDAGAIVHATGPGRHHLEIGYVGMTRLLEAAPRPRRILCLSDLIAYGAYCCLVERGVSVPGEIVLFGFDDNPLNAWIAPWLSAIRIPYEIFGTAVVASLAALIDEGRATTALLNHELVIRGGSPRGPARDVMSQASRIILESKSPGA
jgi:LacI family transcriptional regulator